MDYTNDTFIIWLVRMTVKCYDGEWKAGGHDGYGQFCNEHEMLEYDGCFKDGKHHGKDGKHHGKGQTSNMFGKMLNIL